MISQNFQDEVWNKLNSIERRLSLAGGGGAYAPSDAEFVVMSLSALLPNERVLTAGVGLGLVDGGAGGAATLNVDVGITDDDIVQIDMVGVADNDYAKFTANGLEGRNYAEVLSDLSGQALAAFDWNGQNLTNIGTIGSGAITSSGTVVALALNAANLTLTTPGQISIDVNIDTAAVFMGTKLWYHKTAGATDHNDNFCGQYIVAEMDQAAGEISCLYGGLLYARLTAGNIGDASNARFLIGQLAVADLDGGKVWGDAYGLCATVDQGAGNEVTGNFYGLYSEVDVDGTLGCLAYRLYLDEKSNVDFGIYQDGSAANVFGGTLNVATNLLSVGEVAGKVGIGTTSPQRTFHVYHPTKNVVMVIESGDPGAYVFFKDNTTTDFDTTGMGAIGNNMVCYTRGVERMRIDSTGEVGIGTAPVVGSILALGLGTENLEIIDAGRAGATEQDWIEVEVGGNQGFLRVYAAI